MCNNVLCARTENRKRIEKISTEYYHLRCLQLSLRARSLYLCFCLCLAFHIAFCLSSFPLRVPDCCYCYCYYFLSCFLCSYHGARHPFFFNLKSNLVCVFFFSQLVLHPRTQRLPTTVVCNICVAFVACSWASERECSLTRLCIKMWNSIFSKIC